MRWQSTRSSGSQRSAELYFYPYFRLCCSRLHDAGMLYSVFGWTLCGEQTDSGGRRHWGKPDGCRISAGMFRISDWSKRNLQSAVPIQDPAVCDSVRKCRPGVLETGTVVEYDGRHPQKVNQKKKEKENLHEYQYFNKRIKKNSIRRAIRSWISATQ